MVVYTDGSAHPNPGPGGFGVVAYENENDEAAVFVYQHFDEETTNNEQELKAIVYAMIKYGKTNPKTIVYSDSSYAVNTFNRWMFGWAACGWIKKDKKPPQNLQLIQAYHKLYVDGYRVDLRLIPGHSDIAGNVMADLLATGKIKL